MACCDRRSNASSRELASQTSIGDLQRSLVVRDRDLELLLGATQDEADEQRRRRTISRNSCRAASITSACASVRSLIPDKNIAVCRTGDGTPPRAGAEVLTQTHRHLIGWTQLHRQTMIANRADPDRTVRSVPYKVLACPVMHGRRSVYSACSCCSSH